MHTETKATDFRQKMNHHFVLIVEALLAMPTTTLLMLISLVTLDTYTGVPFAGIGAREFGASAARRLVLDIFVVCVPGMHDAHF